MTLTVTPRFINTPTILRDYEEDQKGYDQVIEGSRVIELSREYDRVDGNEELYKVLLNRLNVPSYSVAGNEGFFESFKAGGAKLIQTVKDFFKWLFSYFTSKSEVAKRKSENLSLALSSYGVVSKDIPFPPTVLGLYNKPGYPNGSLNWMASAMDEVITFSKHIRAYIKVIKGLGPIVQSIRSNEIDKALADRDKLIADSYAAFGIQDPVVGKIVYGQTKLTVSKSGEFAFLDSGLAKKELTFKTDLTEITQLVTKNNELVKESDEMMKDFTALEQEFVRDITASMTIQGMDQAQKDALEKVHQLVRTSMANVNKLSKRVFRTEFTAQGILDSAIARK